MISELERFLSELDTSEPRPVEGMELGGEKAIPPETVAGEEIGHDAKAGTAGRPFAEMPRPGEPLPEDSRTAEPRIPDAVLTARYPLAELCRRTLDSNPAAHKLSADERRWLAEHLEAGVLNWLSYVLKPEPAWDAKCPKGHRITDGIFAQALMGWCCEECGQVYPAGECKLRVRE